jgi:cobalt-zinc-cadmium resistance protein CzcA
MRFNELISDTRSDIAVKVFGGFRCIGTKAREIKEAINRLKGPTLLLKKRNLPQMTVRYDRSKIADGLDGVE